MSFPRGCAWCWFKRTRLPPSPCHGGSCSFLHACYLRVVRTHLHPPPLPPTAGESYPSCMKVIYISPGAVHDVDSSELLSLPLHAPMGVAHSCMNVTYELCELTSTPHPPTAGESYPSCMNVTNGLSLSLGASSPTPSPLGELASPVWMLLTL